MGRMCCKSYSLYNSKECDDCGKCGRVGEESSVTRRLHKYNCNLFTPVKPEVRKELDRIWGKNDKR